MKSIWKKELHRTQMEVQTEDMDTEVAVIGAGMTGILTAFLLQKQGKRVLVLEADRVGGGQTGNTTAKITSQHGMKYQELIREYGIERARLYAKANESAIRFYERIVEEEHIHCDFQRVPSYLYSVQKKPQLKEEVQAARCLGIGASYVEDIGLPISEAGAVRFENQAQFQPLLFIEHLAKKLKVYEETEVYRVKGHTIYTNRGSINAKSIVFAVHFPFMIFPGFYYLRQHQERSYVIAYEGVAPISGLYYGIDEGALSYRMYDRWLLVGGGKHRTGYQDENSGYAAIRRQMLKVFPEAKEARRWSAQDCMPHDGLPFIGHYSGLRPYWYVATGYQKWGMTTAMVAAKLLCDQICGVTSPYERLFSPQRWHPWKAARNFWKDVGISIRGLLKGYQMLSELQEEDLLPGEGGIVRKGWKRYGCYRDIRGEYHRIDLRCPHMGCQLLWNPIEKSWDCPCHGSRFDYTGKQMDDPARKDRKPR